MYFILLQLFFVAQGVNDETSIGLDSFDAIIDGVICEPGAFAFLTYLLLIYI